VVELARELLGLFDLEGVPVGSPCRQEEVDGACDKVWRGADCHLAEVEDEAEDPVHKSDEELVGLVPRNWILKQCGVGLPDQHEDGFDASGDGLFKSAFVGDVEVDVIVDVDTVWSRSGFSTLVEEALVEGIAEDPCESCCFLPLSEWHQLILLRMA
jgi:hypothetical protein